MDSERRTVVIGLHDSMQRDVFSQGASILGFSPVVAEDYEYMRDLISANPDAAGYICDVNLQDRTGRQTVDNGFNIYVAVRERVAKKEARFLALSGSPETIDSASAKGIPQEYLAVKPINLRNWFTTLSEQN